MKVRPVVPCKYLAMRSWQDLVGPGGTAPIEVCSFRDSRQHINSFLRATRPSARGEGRNVTCSFR